MDTSQYVQLATNKLLEADALWVVPVGAETPHGETVRLLRCLITTVRALALAALAHAQRGR